MWRTETEKVQWMVNTDIIQLRGTYLHKETPGMGAKGRSLTRMRLSPGQWGGYPPGAERTGRGIMKPPIAEHTQEHKTSIN